MKFDIKALLAPMVLAALVSCNKGGSNSNNASFYCNGAYYSELQQAVDAASSAKSGQNVTIILTGDASGKGAIIDSASEDDITIDFKSFVYTLEPGCSLHVSENNLTLTGEGGGIASSDAAPAVIAEGSSYVMLTGSLAVKAEEAIAATKSEVTTHSFSGTVEGNVNLDKSQFGLYDSGCSIHIPVLTVSGEDAAFLADTDDEAPVYTAQIDSLVTDCNYPVTSVKSGIINLKTGKVHVHNMKSTHIDGTCISPERLDMVCQDCGFETTKILNECGSCPEDDLVHHKAVAATELECGHPDYWECPLCGKRYSFNNDGVASALESTLFLPEAYLLSPNLLHGFDGVLDWRNEFTTTKDPIAIAGIVLSVIGLLETLGLSIPGLVSSDAGKWNEVNGKLDAIKTELDQINRKIDIIIQQIETIPCKNEILARTKEFNFLRSNTTNAHKAINKILQSNATEEEKKTQIKAVLSDWIKPTYSGDHPQDLTPLMINNFYSRPLGMNYPEMYGKFVNGVSRWEHEGYNLRYQMLLNDISVVGLAYCLTGIYMQEMMEFQSEEMRTLQVNSLKASFKEYTKAIKDEMNLIKDRDGKYRHLNAYNVTFERTMKRFYFRTWFENHRDYCFPRNNHDGNAVNSCNKIMEDMGLNRDYITADQARAIYDLYNSGKSEKISIYRLLADSVGFYNCPSSFNPAVIFTMKNDGFSHENDDSAIPTYKMWHWESYRSSNDNDFFGVYTGLNDDASTANHNFLYKCDINSHDSGKINKLGTDPGWWWHTIMIAQ